MFKELIEAIQAGVNGEPVGDGFYSAPVHLPPALPLPKPLEISTLSGIIEYFNNPVQLPDEPENLTIVIDSPTRVSVYGPIQDNIHQKRPCYLICDCSQILGSGFNFNTWHDLDQFVIFIQSYFSNCATRASVLSVVGNLSNETTEETLDDGVTQRVTLRSGIARKENGVLPNPVILRPYCTFPEIPEPECDYVLRIRKEKGIQAALFKAGGGLWKLQTIQRIRNWLDDHLQEVCDNLPVILS